MSSRHHEERYTLRRSPYDDWERYQQFMFLVVVATVYFLMAQWSFHHSLVNNFVGVIWPASGWALAMSLLFTPWVCVSIFVGAFANSYVSDVSFVGSFATALPPAIYLTIVSVVLKQSKWFSLSLRNVKGVIFFLAVAGGLGPLMGAFLGVSASTLTGVTESGKYLENLAAWFAGDCLGILIVTPLILLPFSRQRVFQKSFKNQKALVSMGVFIVVSWVIFSRILPDALSYYFQIYVIYPFVVWAVFRGRMASAVLANFIVAGGCLLAEYSGRAQFLFLSGGWAIIQIAIFLSITTVCLLIFASVIEERDRVQKHMMRLFKMTQRAVRARQDILEISSHELKSPLGSIRMATELLATMVEVGEPKPKILKTIAQTAATTDRLLSLLNTFLDAEGIRAGAISLEIQDHALYPIVKEAIDILRPMADTKKLTLEFHTTPVELIVRCDRERMIQILVNIVGNAVKYATPQKSVYVEAVVDTSFACLRVSNKGPRIPDEFKPYLFNRFLKWSSKRGTSGTGLGLYIAKTLVASQGGRIWLERSNDQETVFCFTIPLAKSPLSLPKSTEPIPL